METNQKVYWGLGQYHVAVIKKKFMCIKRKGLTDSTAHTHMDAIKSHATIRIKPQPIEQDLIKTESSIKHEHRTLIHFRH